MTAADRTSRGAWNVRFTQPGWTNGDPDFVFGTFLKSTGSANTIERGDYQSAESDALIDAGKTERDEQRRFAAYERLQELAVQDLPVVVLYHEHVAVAHRDTVADLRHRVQWQPTLDTVRLLKRRRAPARRPAVSKARHLQAPAMRTSSRVSWPLARVRSPVMALRMA